MSRTRILGPRLLQPPTQPSTTDGTSPGLTGMGSAFAGIVFFIVGVFLFNAARKKEAEEMQPQVSSKLALEGQAGSQSNQPLNLEDAETLFKLGQVHRLGIGVPQNYEEAFARIAKSAGKGYAEAQNMLGFMYARGQGTTQSSKEAYNWYLLSALQGNPTGQANLGYALADEDSEFHDYAKAVEWLSKSAEQGNDNAQEKLAELYYYGRGIEKNHSLAAKWYRMAAAQGRSPEAERMLDGMQYRGEI